MTFSPALDAVLIELLSRGDGRARARITGSSMEPSLQAGMVVEIEPLSAPPSIGDVLVFRSQRGLVAHRLVGGELFTLRATGGVAVHRHVDQTSGAFVTCGDAYPGRPESVPAQLVVGRVSAVWTSGDADAERVDDERYRRRGRFFARARALRSALATARAYRTALCAMVVSDPARIAPPAAFSALAAATRDFEHGRYAAGVARLARVPRASTIDMARRHHASGLLSRWLDEAAAAGVAVPHELRDALRRIRLTNAMQAGRVLTCVRDVRDRFVAANIPHIFLKGGARLAAQEPGADLQYSGDVDVIVPLEMTARAMTTLRDAGYRDVQTAHWRASHTPWLHHREPLLLPQINVPVEVHFALTPPALVSQSFDYATLDASSRHVRGPIGEVHVLDDVGAALTLAYHARDIAIWRDIVLLSRLLRGFDAAARARFDTLVNAERRDRLRLASAVAVADAIAFDAPVAAGARGRYIAWAEVREDLPPRFGSPDIVEALVGNCPIPKLRLHAYGELMPWLRCWIRNLIALPAVVRVARWRRGRQRSGLVAPGAPGDPMTGAVRR